MSAIFGINEWHLLFEMVAVCVVDEEVRVRDEKDLMIYDCVVIELK